MTPAEFDARARQILEPPWTLRAELATVGQRAAAFRALADEWAASRIEDISGRVTRVTALLPAGFSAPSSGADSPSPLPLGGEGE